MDFISWAQIALICFLGAISPGPSLAMVVSNTVSRGKLYGSITGIFHAFGIVIWAMLTVVGISAVVLSSKSVMTVSQVIGACLILYVGYRTYKTNPKTQSEKTADSGSFQTNLGKAALEGFVISLMNPKIALFFLARIPSFLSILLPRPPKRPIPSFLSILLPMPPDASRRHPNGPFPHFRLWHCQAGLGLVNFCKMHDFLCLDKKYFMCGNVRGRGTT